MISVNRNAFESLIGRNLAPFLSGVNFCYNLFFTKIISVIISLISINGWIPDFAIKTVSIPILVDVKPVISENDPVIQETIDKMLKAVDPDEKQYELLILAASIFESDQPHSYDPCCIGWLYDDFCGPGWENAVVINPTTDDPKLYGLASGYTGWYQDRITDVHDGDHHYSHLDAETLFAMWAQAANSIQWKPSR